MAREEHSLRRFVYKGGEVWAGLRGVAGSRSCEGVPMASLGEPWVSSVPKQWPLSSHSLLVAVAWLGPRGAPDSPQRRELSLQPLGEGLC